MTSEPVSITQMMNDLVKNNLEVLFQKKFEELAILPENSSEGIMLLGKKVTLSIWHDVLTSHEHRIVVQAYKHGILGTGMMHAEGFAISNHDEKRSLTQEELAPFS